MILGHPYLVWVPCCPPLVTSCEECHTGRYSNMYDWRSTTVVTVRRLNIQHLFSIVEKSLKLEEHIVLHIAMILSCIVNISRVFWGFPASCGKNRNRTVQVYIARPINRIIICSSPIPSLLGVFWLAPKGNNPPTTVFIPLPCHDTFIPQTHLNNLIWSRVCHVPSILIQPRSLLSAINYQRGYCSRLGFKVSIDYRSQIPTSHSAFDILSVVMVQSVNKTSLANTIDRNTDQYN